MTAMASLSGPNADHVARASPHRLHDLDAHAPGGAFHRAHGRLDGVGVEVHQLRLGDLPHLSPARLSAPVLVPPPRRLRAAHPPPRPPRGPRRLLPPPDSPARV